MDKVLPQAFAGLREEQLFGKVGGDKPTHCIITGQDLRSAPAVEVKIDPAAGTVVRRYGMLRNINRDMVIEAAALVRAHMHNGKVLDAGSLKKALEAEAARNAVAEAAGEEPEVASAEADAAAGEGTGKKK